MDDRSSRPSYDRYSRPSFDRISRTSFIPNPRFGRFGLAFAAIRNSLRGLFRRRRRARPKEEYRVFITGATTGIGLALAKHLLRTTRYKLILTARPSSLERFPLLGIFESERVMILPLDVEVAEQREEAVRTVLEQWGGVDVLVNNAGVCFRSVAEHVTDAEHARQMEVNYLGPMALARLVLPGMRERRFGRIVNVSSVGGMMAMPTMSVYSASKFALEGASEALWYEVRPWGVNVTLVEPGFVNSDGFQKVVLTGESSTGVHDMWDAYHRHYTNMDELIGRLASFTVHDPRSVASTIAKVIRSPKPPLRVAGTLDALLFGLLRRFLPQSIYFGLLYAMLPRIWEWGDVTPRVKSSVAPPAQSGMVRSVAPASGRVPSVGPASAREGAGPASSIRGPSAAPPAERALPTAASDR